jgi:hypothetical protein
MSFAIRFRDRVDGMMAQGQGLSRSFRQLLEGTMFRGPTLTFVAAGVRRRAQAIMPHAGAVGAFSRLLGHLRRRKTLAIVTGVVGLALFLILLLEISLRIQLAQEARDASTEAALAASAALPETEFNGILPVQFTAALAQSWDQVSAPEGVPSSELTQPFGQVSREPKPLPRSRNR